ncbi:MAG TPA: FAD-binding oxidoreductase [Phycisphaerae bacterium]|nr:FAD-binding oxidoreductase [Phycisphaerae bacterium]HPS52453.1 FAD-binding oxidoreductase [Phycisphaerae bacterium]
MALVANTTSGRTVFTASVEKKTKLTYDIVMLRVRLISPDFISFRPGQFVQMQIPAYEKSPTPQRRSYSIASAPEDNSHIELIIRRVPAGLGTTWIFDYLEEGIEIRFSGPYGKFCMQPTDNPMLWIAGGSGLSPFRAMLYDCITRKISRPIKFYYGAVSEKNLILVDELSQIAGRNGWFEFIPALSQPDADWRGAKGLITDVVARHIECCDRKNLEVYLCGSPGMCDAAIDVLTGHGVGMDRIFYDKFLGQDTSEIPTPDGRAISWDPQRK